MTKKVIEIELSPGGTPGVFAQRTQVNGQKNPNFARSCEVPLSVPETELGDPDAAAHSAPGFIYRRANGPGGAPAEVVIPTLDKLRALGQQLFEHWLSDDLKSFIGNKDKDHVIELRFDLTECPDAADAPFELIATPDKYGGHFLGTQPTTRISRYFAPRSPGAADNPPQPIGGVAQALLLGANPRPDQPLNITAEIEAVTGLKIEDSAIAPDQVIDVPLASGSRIKWTIVPKASAASLVALVRDNRWDIIHFVGHGGRDEVTGSYFIEVHDRNPEREQRIHERDFREALESSLPELLFLNACGTGQSDLASHFTGLAREMVRSGVPYVVAMRGAVLDTVASEFARHFYANIDPGSGTDGKRAMSPTEAASLARAEILKINTDKSEAHRMSFSIPVLYSSRRFDHLGTLLIAPPPLVADPGPQEEQGDTQSPPAAAGQWIDKNKGWLLVLIAGGALLLAGLQTFGSMSPADEPAMESPAGPPPAETPAPAGPAQTAEGEEGEAAASAPDRAESSGAYYEGQWGYSGGYPWEDGEAYDPGDAAIDCSQYPDAPDCLDTAPAPQGSLANRRPDSRNMELKPAPPPPPPPPPPANCDWDLIFFKSGSDMPTEEARRILDNAATMLERCNAPRLLVEGHTDLALSAEKSLRLSQRRAERIKADLRERLPDARIYILALGETNPRVPTADGVHEQQNNRVQIRVITSGTAQSLGIDPAEIAYEEARGAYHDQRKALALKVGEAGRVRPGDPLPAGQQGVFEALEAERRASEALLRSEQADRRQTLAAFAEGQALLERQIAALDIQLNAATDVNSKVSQQAEAARGLESQTAEALLRLAIPTLEASQRADLAQALQGAANALAEAGPAPGWTMENYTDSRSKLESAAGTLDRALNATEAASDAYLAQLSDDQDALLAALQAHQGLRVEITSPFMQPDDRAFARCDGLILRDRLYAALLGKVGEPWSYARVRPADSVAACKDLDPPREVQPVGLPEEGEAGPPEPGADRVVALDRFVVTTPRRRFGPDEGDQPGAGSRLEVRLRIGGLPHLDYEEQGEALVVPTRQIANLAQWLRLADRQAAASDDCEDQDCPADMPAFAAIHLEMPLGAGAMSPALAKRRADWLALVAGEVRRAYGGPVPVVAVQCPAPWTPLGSAEAAYAPDADRVAISVHPSNVRYMLDICPDGGVPEG